MGNKSWIPTTGIRDYILQQKKIPQNVDNIKQALIAFWNKKPPLITNQAQTNSVAFLYKTPSIQAAYSNKLAKI